MTATLGEAEGCCNCTTPLLLGICGLRQAIPEIDAQTDRRGVRT